MKSEEKRKKKRIVKSSEGRYFVQVEEHKDAATRQDQGSMIFKDESAQCEGNSYRLLPSELVCYTAPQHRFLQIFYQ